MRHSPLVDRQLPPASPAPMSAARYARWALAGLGVLMLLFWVIDSVRSRAAMSIRLLSQQHRSQPRRR
jgi:hypothetical protein